MNALELLTELSEKGVLVRMIGDEVQVDAPLGMLTAELRQQIADQKQAILGYLSEQRELDALLEKLRAGNNRHWKIEWARAKRVPMKALIHAASLWLSNDPDDWTAANDTIFQFTSQFGSKQICYRRLPGKGGNYENTTEKT